MAKKVNKKIVRIALVFLSLIVIGGGVLAVRHFSQRDPERNLENARQALAESDYKAAERYFGRAYAYGKTDAWKIERLFEMAEFHLIHNEEHEANWPKALSCWNTVLNIDPQNMPARRNMMQYFFEMADSGSWAAWKNVYDNASELIELIREKGDEPDVELLSAYGRAALAIAQRGGTAERSKFLTEATESFETLIEREPTVASYYSYMADAILIQGELNAQAGFMNARDRARQEAMERLDQAVLSANDKAAALAARYRYEIQAAGNDPNKIESLRAELETHVRTAEPDAKLLTVLSQAYEIPGNSSAEAELNRSIEAARQAARLAPDEFEYSYRLTMLLYRKGSAFDDAAVMQDAVSLAEELKTRPFTQIIPGPQQGRNMAYRNAVTTFLAKCYLEKALDHPDQSLAWIEKAEPLVNQINQYFGSSEHMAVQQWEGILALAKDEREKAVRLLYRAYEQAKALDAPDQPATIDPTLCIMLAHIARQDNQIGLQREFLEKALANRTRVVLDKPSIILDYAEIMTRFGAWNRAMQFAQTYQQRYGANARCQRILTDAAIALDQTELIEETIGALPEGSPERKVIELRLISSQLGNTARQIAQLRAEEKNPSDAMRSELEKLTQEQQRLLFELIKTAPDKIDVQLLHSVCINYLQNDKKNEATALLDAYLAQRPDTLPLRILRLQADEPDPLALPAQRYMEIQMIAAEAISDPKERAKTQAAIYQMRGDLDKTLEMLNAAAEADKDNDADVIEEKYQIAIDREDIKMAEDLWRIMRDRNLDGCEGNLSAAQLELLKKNYAVALRRADEALVINPLSSVAHYLKSRIHLGLEDITSAAASSRQAVQMNPLNSLYSKNHASVLFDRNNALGSRVTSDQKNELLQAITSAIVLNPNDWQLQSVYAEIISEQSPDRALAIRRQLMESHPTPANAVMLGNMALRMAGHERDVAKRSGLIELSGQAFTRALELEPDNESVKAAYAEFLRQTRQNERAEELLRDDKNLLWRYYLQNGQYEKAEQLLAEMYQDNTEDVNVLRGLTLVAEGAGNRTDLKRYLDLLAEIKQDKDGELWLIQKYLDNGYAHEADKKLADFKNHYPDEKLILLIEAWSKMSNGLLDEALSLANRYLESDTENAGAWRLRGRIYRLKNEPRRAVDDLQRSKSLESNPNISMELATIYSEMQQIDAAIGELVSGLQAPQAPNAMRLMLEALYINSNRMADLERFYNRTIDQFPDAPFWPMRAGRYYLSKNEPAQAVPYLEKTWNILREQNSIDPTALNLYLEALVQTRRYNDVITKASEMIDGPIAPIAYAHMAQAYFMQGQRERAESFFITALDKSGTADLFQELILSMMTKTVGQDTAMRWAQNNPDALPNMLLSYRLALRDERFNRGLEFIDKCLETTDPEKAEWGNFAIKKGNLLVQAFMKTADRDYMNRAIDLFRQIVDRYPNSPSILNNLAYLMASNEEQIDMAVRYARRAHQSDPGNPTYLDTYAYAQYRNGQSEQALQNLLRAVHLFDVNRQPIPWEVYNHLGLVYETVGETAQALDNFRKALDAASDVPEKELDRLKERIANLQQQANTST